MFQEASFLHPELYFNCIRFQQNSDLVRSVPQILKVWMPPAYTFIKLVHILWLAAAAILMWQLPCSAFIKCVYAMFLLWQQQLKPLLSDTDIAPEITQSPILQKRGTCFSHYVVVCTVQTAGAVGVFVFPPSWWAVLRGRRRAILYLIHCFARQTIFIHSPMILNSLSFLFYAHVYIYVSHWKHSQLVLLNLGIFAPSVGSVILRQSVSRSF
jgi:hypothetical protein